MALTKTDMEDLTRLINYTKTVIDVAQNLMILEFKGLYGTPEYEEQFEKLKYWLNISDSMFAQISTDYSKNQNFIAVLLDQASSKMEFNGNIIVQTCPLLSKKDLVLYRLYNKFLFSLFANEDQFVKDGAIIASKTHNRVFNPNDDIFRRTTMYQTVTVSYIAADCYNIYLVLLNEHFQGTPSEKHFAIEQKYFSALLLPELEKIFLNSKFSLNERPFLIHHLPKKLYNISDEIENEYLEFTVINIFRSIIDQFLKFKDKDLNIPQIGFLFRALTLILRSHLALVDDKLIAKLKETTETTLKNQANSQNLDIIAAIKDLFNHVDQDKQIPLSLEFNL